MRVISDPQIATSAPVVKAKLTLLIVKAAAHTSKSTLSWISKHFRVLRIPPQSPELNPIETIFAIMKKNIQDSKPQKFEKTKFE